MPKTWRILCPFCIVLLVCLATCTDALQIEGSGSLGAFEGTLEVSRGDEGQQAVLTLELTNAASPGDDAVITGWYLNNPGGRITSVTMMDSVFVLLGGPVYRNSIDASPAGYFDIGGVVEEDPVNTGERTDRAAFEGIEPGQPRRFQLILRGGDLESLDANSFTAERPEGGECFLAVRIQRSGADEAEIVPASRVFDPETMVTPAAGSSMPRGYALLPNYPNPFNASTNIGFQLPSSGHVSLIIYDVLGRMARRLVNRHQEAGNYIARWDGRNDQGRVMKSGVYFCVFESGSSRETIKMVLSR